MSVRRIKIGSLRIDTAAIVVGDPCQLIYDRRATGPPIEYSELIAARSTRGSDRDPCDPLFLGDDACVVIPTVENCDGWCAVSVERDAAGWARRLIVHLNSGPKYRRS